VGDSHVFAVRHVAAFACLQHQILITQQGVFDALRVGLNGDGARRFLLPASAFNLRRGALRDILVF
jgi:hypothetical protein